MARTASKTTRATQALDRAGTRYSLHAYDYDPEAQRVGIRFPPDEQPKYTGGMQESPLCL